MKITSVEMVPEGSSNICVMSFRDPRRENPYNVKQIVGLDADEIVARYYGISGDSSASKMFNLVLEKRDVVALIELNPTFSTNQTYSDLRTALYKMIAASRTGKVWLHFKNEDESVAAVSGFVKKFEAGHFSKNPEVQMTIECEDPMLRALTPVDIDVVGLSPSDTTISDPLSTAPHGFVFELKVNAPRGSIYIGDTTPIQWGFEVTPADEFQVNDVLHFSSEHNNKYLYIQRGLEKIHLGDVIATGSVWPILFPGDNNFVFSSPAGLEWVAISHFPTYWGV